MNEAKIEMARRMATAPNLPTRDNRRGLSKCLRIRQQLKGWGCANHKSARKVAVNIGDTTRRSRINAAAEGLNSSFRGDFFRSRAVWATRTERVRESSKSMLQSMALKKKSGETAADDNRDRSS